MDTRRIKKLIELVKETGVGELEVKSGEDSVRISYHPSGTAPLVQHQVVAPAPAVAPAPVCSSDVTKDPAASPLQPPVVDDGIVLKSPMVGTVYLAATPGAKPFVSVGDRVNVGDTLCLIEAMKMFNKIEAETAGIVSARMVENESPVEFDQPLFVIDPDN